MSKYLTPPKENKSSNDEVMDTNNNTNIIDNYVALQLTVNKWKNRLFDIEKYKVIWILDEYNKEKKKGYCIIPTDEEIRKNEIINKNENRIRIINHYNPKNCKIISNHGMEFNAIKNEKLYIPYRILCKFEKEICILNINGNEISWTINAPSYNENNVIFYTSDFDPLSNLLILPIVNMENGRILSCLQYCQEMGLVLKFIPQEFEISILKCLRNFGVHVLESLHSYTLPTLLNNQARSKVDN